DALVEHLTAVLLVLHLLLALDGQGVLLGLERQLVLGEPGHGDRDAISVISGTLDIVGRVARSGLEAVEHGEQPVETDGRTIEGSKIESSHGITSKFERNADGPPEGPNRLIAHPHWGPRSPDVGAVQAGRKGRRRTDDRGHMSE